MKKPYHIVDRKAERAASAVEEFAKANGQMLLPLMELVTQARVAVEATSTGSAGRPSKPS